MRRARGFTYVGLLIAIALAGAALGGAGTLWSTDSRREREKELLFAGDQFRKAIGSYYGEAPAGQPHRYPAKLDDLLNDKRWPTARRHLRKVFVDPITGTRDWMLVRAADQTIVGVHSASEEAPMKRANFPEDYSQFEAAKSYREWSFVWKPDTKPALPPGTPIPRTPVPPGAPTK